jgi:hypothetical protein
MEYGEGGSYHCELTYNGKKVAELYEEGNGGPLDYRFDDPAMEKEVGDAVLAFLKRTDKDYGPDSQYDFCKNATEASECEYGTLVNELINEKDRRKHAEKMLKRGFPMAGIFEDFANMNTIGGTTEAIITKLAEVKYNLKYDKASFYTFDKGTEKIVADL